jgi:hypothetical protein
MKNKSKWLPVLLIIYSSVAESQMRTISYDEAIQIALDESFYRKISQRSMGTTRYSYLYAKANFKRSLKFDMFTPQWEESLSTIFQANGLPVYNSTGSLQAGGNLNFEYVLPTGGNFTFKSRMFLEDYWTTLSEMDSKMMMQNHFFPA